MVVAFSCLAALTPVPGQAQEQADSLRALYRLHMPEAAPGVFAGPRTPPGSSAGSPTAFGAGWGDAFMGAGFQQRARFVDAVDGTVVAGFGLGNPRSLIGAEVALTSFSTIRSGFLKHSGVSVKLHRLFPADLGVAVGWENAWTSSARTDWDEGSSYYAVVSRVVDTNGEGAFTSVTASLGVGTGRFRSEQRILNDEGGVGVFASLGVRVLDHASIIADWTGQDLGIAYSFVPFRSFPLVLTPAVVDLMGTAGDGARFVLGVGAGFRFVDNRNIP
jgi:hypothetical protein